MNTSLRQLAPVLLVSVLTAACSSDDDSSGDSGVPVEQRMQSARTSYADLMFASYSDVVGLAEDMDVAITAFVAAPDATTLQAAKDAWTLARPYYQQTEVGRFYDGPIDDANGPEGELNAWPLDENYIDYVNGNANAGIINDAAGFPDIDEATLRAANGVGGDANVATGWHAIEFLLWGQDFDANGPGARPFEDYTTLTNFARRGEYLELCAELLVADLITVRDDWHPTTGTYRAAFAAMPAATTMELIMTGIATLGVGELRGERILVPYNSQSEEDEHSCFSDTTHLDHIHDGIGIRNIWRGEYTAFDSQYDFSGTGLDDVFAVGSAAHGTALNTAVNAVVTALEAQVDPFDQAILGLDTTPGRLALQAAIDALSEYNAAISAAAAALNLTITSV